MALWINFHNSYFYATLNCDKMLDLMVLTREIKTLSTVLTFLNTHTYTHAHPHTHTRRHTSTPNIDNQRKQHTNSQYKNKPKSCNLSLLSIAILISHWK
jgi:hypothetical protein